MRKATLLAAALASLSCSRAPAPSGAPVAFSELAAMPVPPADQRESYGPLPLQFGELRYPRGRGPFPLVVMIHGGCWRSAFDLRYMAHAASALTRAGVAVWTIEFRRVGDAGGGWPGTFLDVARGVDHVRVLAERYPQIDASRVVLLGHSAGAQLALWVASRRAYGGVLPGVEMTDDVPLPLRGVVSLAGITDLAAYEAPTGCGSAVQPLVGGTRGEVGERYAAVNPIERIPLGVPVRLVHGALDPIVPLSQSRVYAERSRARGGRAEVTVVEGAGHFDVVAPGSMAWSAVVDAVRALVAAR